MPKWHGFDRAAKQDRANKADKGGLREATAKEQPWLRHCVEWTALCPDLAEGHEVFMRSKRSLSAWRLMEKEGAGEGQGAASAGLPRPPGDSR